ncbi:MAG: hypothetical protein MUE40_06255 [Anaerolineae bacterium]|jgi:hypothetical protein|nr:hypothetical protein [Anaerolineae bacterium]
MPDSLPPKPKRKRGLTPEMQQWLEVLLIIAIMPVTLAAIGAVIHLLLAAR